MLHLSRKPKKVPSTQLLSEKGYFPDVYPSFTPHFPHFIGKIPLSVNLCLRLGTIDFTFAVTFFEVVSSNDQ